jgi:uncharacterized membrane protein YeaQ/YmgE (transglycosylase-associated protein family)
VNIIAWIVVGLIAGLVGSWLMKAKTGVLTDIILGIVGAILGGWIAGLLLGVDVMTGLNLTSIIVAILGAILVIFLYRLMRRGGA